MSAGVSDEVLTVAIPVRNDRELLDACLESIEMQDFDGAVEILVVDGCSTDGSADVVRRRAAASEPSRIRLLRNESESVPAALNIALRAAQGHVLVRVDARARLRPNHLSRARDLLAQEGSVVAVGGGQRPVASATTWSAKGIARALGNRVTSGLSRYRWASTAGPSDTVWLGAYRRDSLLSIGGWDERRQRNEDYDLHRRLRDAGQVVWFDPSLTADYVARSKLPAVARQHYEYGRAKGRHWRLRQEPIARRHVALLSVGAVAVFGTAALVRRSPIGGLAAGLGVAVTADAVGSGPGTLSERSGGVVALTVVDLAWFAGVLVGAISA